MIEITIQVADFETGRRLVALLRDASASETHRGQARHYQAAAARLDRLVRPFRAYAPRAKRPQAQEIDEGAIQRVVHGEQPLPVLSRAEARIACLRLTDRGKSAAVIARRTQIAPRTVQRWRAEDRPAVTA
ncbi:helix-turn-helix domain-containing protein [Streptomyces sp. NPDC051016]|uniref:helix-turn-helix domain-containing protein n=1 Tax=Streptomyces sp. NPDC051016 TaxID=3365638 RepID=UPI003792122B